MQAETKSGKIIIENGKITLVREGFLGALAGFSQIILTPLHIILGTNTDKTIEISKIEKVEYTSGISHITRPHMKVSYGKPKPRFVIFKKPFVDLANREGAISEMKKAVDELKRLGVNCIEV